MKLTDEQIQFLFRFTEKKRVVWYDLQAELVDHLASRIEEEREAKPGLDFERALDTVYKEFGIFGFAKIVQEKSDQLHKQSKRMWWGAIHEFFTWPKLVLLALVSYVFWQLGNLFDCTILMIALITADIASSIVLIRLMSGAYKGKRKLLLLQSGTGYSSSFIFFYEIFLISSYDNTGPLKFCILATIGFLFKLASFQVFFKVRKKAMELYPEA